MNVSHSIPGFVLLLGLAAAGAFSPSSALAPARGAHTEDTPYMKASVIKRYANPHQLRLRSESVLVVDDRDQVILFSQHIDSPRPIASLTKLMTGLVILESDLPLDEQIEITRDDRDHLRGTRSRLAYGSVFSRYDLLKASLVASENRAAAALARTYPGGTTAFVAAMNAKAQALGMSNTQFADSSGLDSHNVSTARDLAILVKATKNHVLLQTVTTAQGLHIKDSNSEDSLTYRNTNRLIHRHNWDITLSKTGYTSDAGNCLVMNLEIGHRQVTVILLNSWGKYSKYADAERIRQWLLNAEQRVPLITAHNSHALAGSL